MSAKTNRLKNRLRIEAEQAAKKNRVVVGQCREAQVAAGVAKSEAERLRKSHIVLDIIEPTTHYYLTAAVTSRMHNGNGMPQAIRCEHNISAESLKMAKGHQEVEQIFAFASKQITSRLAAYAAERGLTFKK